MKLEEGATLQLQNFHISNLGHIRVDVGGLGPLDWILEILVDFVDSFLKVTVSLNALLQKETDSRLHHFPCPGLDCGPGGGSAEGPYSEPVRPVSHRLRPLHLI